MWGVSYTRAEFLHLTSGIAELSAYGEVEWVDLKRAWRTTLPVAVSGFCILEGKATITEFSKTPHTY